MTVEVEMYITVNVNVDMTFDEADALETIKEKLRKPETIYCVRKDFENDFMTANMDSHTGGRF